MAIELIPSAKRLIRSLRDIGYEFVDAVADIVDNSIEAEATAISIRLEFNGEDSYLTIADNGIGMASKEIHEALRFGSNSSYSEYEDLGRYGLGLKTASLSQAEKLTVSSRRSSERARINSFCWSLEHIEKTNRWEILEVDRNDLKNEVYNHLNRTTGTVVTWEKLGRLLGYKYPLGEHARKQSAQMIDSLKNHLGMVFHRFLSGEVRSKRIAIYVNDERVVPWDPFSRGERHTLTLEPINLPIDLNERIYNVKLQPYVLPPQSLYSSSKAHIQASGPNKWNKQQGIYIYRSNRIIQAGGWNGLRTNDEHTKLLRIALYIPQQIEELFQVNVAKKHAVLPRDLRGQILKSIQHTIQKAQEVYREKNSALNLSNALSENSTVLVSNENITERLNNTQRDISYKESRNLQSLIKQVVSRWKFRSEHIEAEELLQDIFSKMTKIEQHKFQEFLARYALNDSLKLLQFKDQL
jgi:hypothetical protein